MMQESSEQWKSQHFSTASTRLSFTVLVFLYILSYVDNKVIWWCVWCCNSIKSEISLIVSSTISSRWFSLHKEVNSFVLYCVHSRDSRIVAGWNMFLLPASQFQPAPKSWCRFHTDQTGSNTSDCESEKNNCGPLITNSGSESTRWRTFILIFILSVSHSKTICCSKDPNISCNIQDIKSKISSLEIQI